MSNNKFHASENEWEFNYTGSIQEFKIPYSGKYKIEIYGAQGGSTSVESGGQGGSTILNVALLKDKNLFIEKYKKVL